MKTLLLLAAVCASVVSVSASTVDITEMNVSYSPPSSIGWSVQAPQLSRPFDNLHDFDGAGIVSGLSITCSAPCGVGSHVTVDLQVSGLTLGTGFSNSIVFNGVVYPTVYLSGTLDLTTKSFVLLQNPGFGGYTAPVLMTGTFTACADPACATQLFPMSVNLLGTAYMSLSINSSGQPVLDDARFMAPEPASAALMFSGCLLIAGFVYASRKQGGRLRRDFLSLGNIS